MKGMRACKFKSFKLAQSAQREEPINFEYKSLTIQ